MSDSTTTETLSPDEKKSESIMSSLWRPCMGFTYMFICLFDFVLAPMMHTAVSVLTKTEMVVWKSLTMSEGGLFHISMGAILGVSAWIRGIEKSVNK